ncbi:MAG: biopolymer transporter ExbD [Paracoccus sp. (in: a-proteobacteria)]|uniref:ExbD/TolR family protein n=1 Tax=Paracoccus sp. TaxID=267 RepID=UPI0026E0A273|nr:biopolymer transporter ExbD [Paracoccus sp. (in: a-proteobacteria)]MDO5612951.1 biopolymer transporter ExbD [Paracoccus sp. (in: a-proteobacteria)]
MSVSLPSHPHPRRIDVSLAIVNIVLLLIFFFLVSGQIGASDRAVMPDLPETAELPLDQLPRPILIVTPQGDWLLNDEPVAPDLLGVALAQLPQPVTLNVLIDRAAPADVLVALLQDPALQGVAMRLVTLRHRGGRA